MLRAVALGLVLLAPALGQAQVEERELALAVGQTARIRAGGVARYTLDVEGLASVTPGEDGLWLIVGGRAPGECRLRLEHVDGSETSYHIVVADAPAGPRRVPAEEHQVRAFTLGVGEVLTIPAAGIASFSSSGPDLVELTVSPDGANLTARGVAVGRRTVFVIFVDGHAERYTFEVR